MPKMKRRKTCQGDIRAILYNARRCSSPDLALQALALHLERSLSHADVQQGTLDDMTATRAVRFLDANYPDRTSGVVGRIMGETEG